MRSMTRTGFQCLAVLVLYILCTACGGGGGGGGIILPSNCLEFVASTPTQQFSLAKSSSSTCDSLAIDVQVNSVSDLYAVSYTLAYPAAIADYTTFTTTGSVLAPGATLINQVDDNVGSVTIALSRSGTGVGVNVAGTQKVMTLVFSKVGTSSANAAAVISGAKIFDSSTPPVELPLTGSAGGTISIQ